MQSISLISALTAYIVEPVLSILGDNVVGIYLQGSHALGDADKDSDCDVRVVIANHFFGVYDLNHAEDSARTPDFLQYMLEVAELHL